eukprot:3027483-Rhodomonas_salina.2
MASALDEIAMSANVFRVLDFAASLSSSSSESKPKSRVSHPRGRWGVNSQPEHVEYIRTSAPIPPQDGGANVGLRSWGPQSHAGKAAALAAHSRSFMRGESRREEGEERREER